jgi:hypothetical protein
VKPCTVFAWGLALLMSVDTVVYVFASDGHSRWGLSVAAAVLAASAVAGLITSLVTAVTGPRGIVLASAVAAGSIAIEQWPDAGGSIPLSAAAFVVLVALAILPPVRGNSRPRARREGGNSGASQ